jgi:2-polyprenyl-3-methyl-5-hydroxy-6-metoxy-1,4-benzoquinol methylase
MREVFDITVPWITDIPAAEITCLLCGHRNIIPLNTFLLNGKRFHTVRCLSDGMMWLDPQPTQEFYHQLYTEHYHRAGQDDPLLEQATLDVHTDETRLREAAILRLNEIEEFASPGRFLEVGFGSGYTLMEAKARGWDVFGLEIAHSCVDDMRARGIAAVCASLTDYAGPRETFDVVAMYSVIEHVHDPSAFLRQAHALLKPNGLLVLRLPDTPDEGPPASLIAHLYHFNQSTISELLRRNHFEVRKFGSFSVWKPKRYPGELPNMNVISRKA